VACTVFPSGARGTARDALDALAKLDEALGEEVRLQIAAQSIHSLAEAATALGRKYNAILTPADADHEDSARTGSASLYHPLNWYKPVESIKPINICASSVRAWSGRRRKTSHHRRSFLKRLMRFLHRLPWPTTVEDYVASLNGETKFFADRLCKNGDEFTPSTPIPGRDRHRKLFCLTANGPNSVTCKALKERIPTPLVWLDWSMPATRSLSLSKSETLSWVSCRRPGLHRGIPFVAPRKAIASH